MATEKTPTSAATTPVATLASEEFAAHLGSPFLGQVFGLDVPASSTATQALLGWRPQHAGLLADLATGD